MERIDHLTNTYGKHCDYTLSNTFGTNAALINAYIRYAEALRRHWTERTLDSRDTATSSTRKLITTQTRVRETSLTNTEPIEANITNSIRADNLPNCTI